MLRSARPRRPRQAGRGTPRRDAGRSRAARRTGSAWPALAPPVWRRSTASPAIAGFDYRDTDLHKRIVADAYAGGQWRVPELLDRLKTTEDLYFDSVSQVHLSAWARGRIAVLDDAASSVSLFGDGSSLAMAGAFTLAGALAANPTDHAAAFRRFEAEHRTLVEPKQRGIGRATALLVPKTRFGIAVRNLAARAWPTQR